MVGHEITESPEPSAAGTKGQGAPSSVAGVAEDIAVGILTGRFDPGSRLPREEDLCETYGISRTMVREALKILAAKGFIRSRPRIGSTIRPAEDWNLLDPEVMAWHGPALFNRVLLDAFVEARLLIEPAVARMATARATLRDLGDLEGALDRMSAARDDRPAFTRADIDFHRALYRACGNPFLQRIGFLIDEALKFSITTTTTIAEGRHEEAVERHRAVLEALRMRDSDAAAEAAAVIIRQSSIDLDRVPSADGHARNGERLS